SGHEQHGALHERKVLREDPADDEAPEARPAEHGLDDHGARQQIAELEPEDRDHRDQRVLQRVPHDDPPPRQALGARRPHVVLAEHLQHARAGEARDDRGSDHPERHARQAEVPEGAAARRLRIEVPISPRSALPTKRPYCFKIGSSRWSCARICSIWSGVVTNSASIIFTGSPGTRNSMLNTARVTPNSTGITARNRRPRYVSTPGRSSRYRRIVTSLRTGYALKLYFAPCTLARYAHTERSSSSGTVSASSIASFSIARYTARRFAGSNSRRPCSRSWSSLA